MQQSCSRARIRTTQRESEAGIAGGAPGELRERLSRLAALGGGPFRENRAGATYIRAFATFGGGRQGDVGASSAILSPERGTLSI